MPISYRQAGVDIDAGAELVRRIGPIARATRIPEVLAAVGGFAGLCGLPPGLSEPVLVSGADGVGTKLKLAFATGVHDTVGIDLVAMCANDVLTSGARPLFFLDYLATGKLDVDCAESVVRGIAEGCRRAGCALLGGETAELPDMYAPGEYDLAGFVVGVVDRAQILDGRRIGEGDAVIAIASSGLHSNGYSLARRVLLEGAAPGLDEPLEGLGCTVAQALLEPTRIYAGAVLELRATIGAHLHGLCHITGGGLVDNIPRVLPEGTEARLDLSSYRRPELFEIIARCGPVEEAEMRRTFNLGVGMVAVGGADHAERAIAELRGAGERAWQLGRIAGSSVRAVRFD